MAVSGCPDQRECDRMIGDSDADGTRAGSHHLGRSGDARRTIVSGPGMNRRISSHATSGISTATRADVVLGGHLDRQRVVRRPALDFEYAGDGIGIERIGGETVDGLGRERDQFPRRIASAAVWIASVAGRAGLNSRITVSMLDATDGGHWWSKVQPQCLCQTVERICLGFTLAGNIHLEALGDVPVAFLPYTSREHSLQADYLRSSQVDYSAAGILLAITFDHTLA